MDTKAGESTRIICTSWMYFKRNVYEGYAIYSGQIRYPVKICTEGQLYTNKQPDQETQNEMVGPYHESATRSHTKSSNEKRVKWSSQDYMDNIYYSRTVRYSSDFGGSSSDRSRPRKRWRNDIVTLCPTWG